MKKIILSSLFVLFLIAYGCEKSAQDAVQARLDTIITILQKDQLTDNDISEMSGYLVYRGSEQSRRWKDVMNPAVEEEKALVKGFMEEMREQFTRVTDYEYGEFLTEEKSEGVWYIQQVTASTGMQYYFAMLNVNGEYVIGDIDTVQ